MLFEAMRGGLIQRERDSLLSLYGVQAAKQLWSQRASNSGDDAVRGFMQTDQKPRLDL